MGEVVEQDGHVMDVLNGQIAQPCAFHLENATPLAQVHAEPENNSFPSAPAALVHLYLYTSAARPAQQRWQADPTNYAVAHNYLAEACTVEKRKVFWARLNVVAGPDRDELAELHENVRQCLSSVSSRRGCESRILLGRD